MRRVALERPDEIVAFFLDAYRQGAFPMADVARPTRYRGRASGSVPPPAPGSASSVIHWYSPDPRAILPLDAVHVPRTLGRLVRNPPFEFTFDACFERVIRACAEPRPTKAGEPGGQPWLDETLIRAYCLLHQHGHAHSLEAWLPAKTAAISPTLVGGIYGVHLGGAFFAESMFCRPAAGGTNASNLCLLCLVGHLRSLGCELLDVQIVNTHTERFGVIEIPRSKYLKLLGPALARPITWMPPVHVKPLALGAAAQDHRPA